MRVPAGGAQHVGDLVGVVIGLDIVGNAGDDDREAPELAQIVDKLRGGCVIDRPTLGLLAQLRDLRLERGDLRAQRGQRVVDRIERGGRSFARVRQGLRKRVELAPKTLQPGDLGGTLVAQDRGAHPLLPVQGPHSYQPDEKHRNQPSALGPEPARQRDRLDHGEGEDDGDRNRRSPLPHRLKPRNQPRRHRSSVWDAPFQLVQPDRGMRVGWRAPVAARR